MILRVDTGPIRLPKSLLSPLDYPPGFDKDGRHLLKRCQEFALYELYEPGGGQVLETAPEIERALWRGLFRINDSWERKRRDERIAWAVALKKLNSFTVHCYQRGDSGAVPVARELAATIGAAIGKVLSSKDPETAAQRCGVMLRDAVRAVVRDAGCMQDKRTNKLIPAVAVLIWEAQGMFQHTKKRPRKSQLRQRMGAIGYGFSGPTAAARWRELFLRAGLANLPE